MSPRDWRLRIDDILSAIDKIQRYTEGMTGESLATDEKTLDAVLHDVTVIGEAARNVPAEIVERHPEVPWAAMGDMRNVVVHEYFGVLVETLWTTITDDLPPLLLQLRALLENEAPR